MAILSTSALTFGPTVIADRLRSSALANDGWPLVGRKIERHAHGAHVRDDETQESPIELSRHSRIMPHMFETGSTASSLSVHFLVRCKRKRVPRLPLDDDQANALG